MHRHIHVHYPLLSTSTRVLREFVNATTCTATTEDHAFTSATRDFIVICGCCVYDSSSECDSESDCDCNSNSAGVGTDSASVDVANCETTTGHVDT